MGNLGTLAEALGIAYAGGINLYATVAILGLAQALGWVGPLPSPLHALAMWIPAPITSSASATTPWCSDSASPN